MSTEKVRFYWQHDLDLVALVLNPDFDAGSWIRRSVIARVRNQPFAIPIPKNLDIPIKIDNCVVYFYLDPTEDADVIAMLNGFRSGVRNSAIKQIFRSYLDEPVLLPYMTSSAFIVKGRGRYKTKDEDADMEFPDKTETPSNLKVFSPIGSYLSPADNNQENTQAVEKTQPERHDTEKKSLLPKQTGIEKETPKVPEHSSIISSANEKPIENDKKAEESGFDLFGAINNLLDF